MLSAGHQPKTGVRLYGGAILPDMRSRADMYRAKCMPLLYGPRTTWRQPIPRPRGEKKTRPRGSRNPCPCKSKRPERMGFTPASCTRPITQDRLPPQLVKNPNRGRDCTYCHLPAYIVWNCHHACVLATDAKCAKCALNNILDDTTHLSKMGTSLAN